MTVSARRVLDHEPGIGDRPVTLYAGKLRARMMVALLEALAYDVCGLEAVSP